MSMSRILIIEDDPYVGRFYEKLFKFSDYEVDLVLNGDEGLEKARELKPSLILLDILMPGMDGLEVLRRLKGDTVTKELIVVMLTNLSDTSTVKKAAELGADGFIVKSSVEPQQLLSEVNKYLTQKTYGKNINS